MVYTGENITFTSVESLKVKVTCDFDYKFFPFDEHRCEIPIALVPHSSEHVCFDRIISKYLGGVSIPVFNIPGAYIKHQGIDLDGKNHCGVVLEIFLIRRSALIFISVFLPSIILIFINSASLWINGNEPSLLRLIVSFVVLFSLLILWLLISLSSDVQGQVRAIDVWLSFCTTHSLLHILVHVLAEVFAVSKTQRLFVRGSRPGSRSREIKPIESVSIYDSFIKTAQEMDGDHLWTPNYWIIFIARVVSISLIVLFNITFWPFVLYYSGNQLPWRI